MATTYQLTFKIEGHDFRATLLDNQTTRQLRSQLPLKFEMLDLDKQEKYVYFDQDFTANPVSIPQIQPGDLFLFEKNCLVLFYVPGKTHYRYTPLGHVEPTKNFKSYLDRSRVAIEMRL